MRVHKFTRDGVACGDLEFGRDSRHLKNPTEIVASADVCVVVDGNRLVHFYDGTERPYVHTVKGTAPRCVCLDSDGQTVFGCATTIKRVRSDQIETIGNVGRTAFKIAATGTGLVALIRGGNVIRMDGSLVFENATNIAANDDHLACFTDDGKVRLIK